MQQVPIQYNYEIKAQTSITNFTYVTQVRHNSAGIDGTLAKKPGRYKNELGPGEGREGVGVPALPQGGAQPAHGTGTMGCFLLQTKV